MRLSLILVFLLGAASIQAQFSAKREGTYLVLAWTRAHRDITTEAVTQTLSSFLKTHHDWLLFEKRLATPVRDKLELRFPSFFVYPVLFIEDAEFQLQHHLNRVFFPRKK